MNKVIHRGLKDVLWFKWCRPKIPYLCHVDVGLCCSQGVSLFLLSHDQLDCRIPHTHATVAYTGIFIAMHALLCAQTSVYTLEYASMCPTRRSMYTCTLIFSANASEEISLAVLFWAQLTVLPHSLVPMSLVASPPHMAYALLLSLYPQCCEVRNHISWDSQPLACFFLNFYFTGMNVVTVGMSVSHAFLVPSQASGSHRSPGTGITVAVSYHVGACNQTLVSERAAGAVNHRASSPALPLPRS